MYVDTIDKHQEFIYIS